MGVAFSSLWSSLFGKKELKIVVLGLDNAGKTTLTYRMCLGQVVATAPTIGSQVETFEYKNLKFMLFDVGGQTSIRTSWTMYLQATNAVVFVVDTTDRARAGLARQELHRVAAEESVSKAPVLVFANKQDVAGAMTPGEVSEALALTSLPISWHIQGCSALTGKGVNDGLDWLAEKLGATG